MTKPTPPTLSTGDRRFARDVAKQLDRRRMRRKLVFWTAILALLAAAALYLRCGQGFGLGGLGKGTGETGGSGSAHTPAAPRRCALRVTAHGITVDGKPMPRDEAVAACRATAGADVVVTGDARHGDWVEVHDALDAAGVPTFLRDQPSTGSGTTGTTGTTGPK
jgi:hypothetical protein